MPDLLAHVLFAYAVVRIASWRWTWITPAHVTIAMVGATVPDVSKIDLFMDDDWLEVLLGASVDWYALHTIGGVFVSIFVGALLVVPSERRRAFRLLAVGAASHLLLDLFLRTASGLSSYPIFWPITYYRPLTPGLYLSTDWWPTAATAILAGVVWAVNGWIGRTNSRQSDAELL